MNLLHDAILREEVLLKVL